MSYTFSDNKEIDVRKVTALFRLTDWAKDRTEEETKAVLAQSSLVLSVWENDRLIAMARALTDFVFRAAIYDVIVHPDFQRKGVGRALTEKLLSHPSLKKVPAFHLLTKDKRPFYEKLGFVTTTERGLDAMILIRNPFSLRSPRKTLGGYVLLPRLIDKIRLHAEGRLPPEYERNLLKPGLTLDGRFLSFTELDGEALRGALLAAPTDEEALIWVEKNARPHTMAEKERWAAEIEAYRPDPAAAQRRKMFYPELAAKIDLAAISVFDMIDMDEGRIPIK